MSRLTEFLKQRKDKELTQGSKRERMVEEWQGVLTTFFSQIKQWVREAQQQGLLDVQEEQTTVTEERLGSYRAPLLKLRAGSTTVLLKPIGREIIGFSGRVDMVAPRGTYLFLYSAVDGQWVHPQNHRKGSKPSFVPLTEALFTELLMHALA